LIGAVLTRLPYALQLLPERVVEDGRHVVIIKGTGMFAGYQALAGNEKE
jgi:hypothetical protein